MKDSVPTRLSSISVIKKKEKLSVRRTQSCTFLHLLPQSLRPCIQTVKDVATDDNCGFRAIADFLGMGEDSWMHVRMNLSN